MALSQITIPPDPKRDGRARALAGYVATWPRVTLTQQWGSFEAGTTFRRAYGSKGARYLVNSVACQCPDYAERGHICKHIRAVTMWEQSQQPAPRKTIEQIWPTCAEPGCDEDPAPRSRFCEQHWLCDAF